MQRKYDEKTVIRFVLGLLVVLILLPYLRRQERARKREEELLAGEQGAELVSGMTNARRYSRIKYHYENNQAYFLDYSLAFHDETKMVSLLNGEGKVVLDHIQSVYFTNSHLVTFFTEETDSYYLLTKEKSLVPVENTIRIVDLYAHGEKLPYRGGSFRKDLADGGSEYWLITENLGPAKIQLIEADNIPIEVDISGPEPKEIEFIPLYEKNISR